MEEQNLKQEPKNNKIFIIGIVILLLIVLTVGAYWLLQGNQNNIVNRPLSEKEVKWLTYVSDNQGFKMDYPNNWEMLTDDDFIFGINKYDNNQESEAKIRIKRIQATNKVELQEALNKENLDVDIESLKKIKICRTAS
jgi:hypothetical protein